MYPDSRLQVTKQPSTYNFSAYRMVELLGVHEEKEGKSNNKEYEREEDKLGIGMDHPSQNTCHPNLYKGGHVARVYWVR